MEKCPLLKKTNFGVRYHQRHGAMQHLCTCQCKEDRADLFGLGGAVVAALTLAAQWPPNQSAAAIDPESEAYWDAFVASHDDAVVGHTGEWDEATAGASASRLPIVESDEATAGASASRLPIVESDEATAGASASRLPIVESDEATAGASASTVITLNSAITAQINEIRDWNRWGETRSQGIQKLLQFMKLSRVPANIDQLRQQLLTEAEGAWHQQLRPMILKVAKNAKPFVADVFKAYTQQYLGIAPLSYDITFLQSLQHKDYVTAEQKAFTVLKTIDADQDDEKAEERAGQLVNLLKVRPSLLQGKHRNHVMDFIDAQAIVGLQEASTYQLFVRHMCVTLSIHVQTAIDDLKIVSKIDVITTQTKHDRIINMLRETFDARVHLVAGVSFDTVSIWVMGKDQIIKVAMAVAKQSSGKTLYDSLEQAAVDDRAMRTRVENIFYGKVSGIQTKADKHDRDNELLSYGLLVTAVGGLITLGVALAKYGSGCRRGASAHQQRKKPVVNYMMIVDKDVYAFGNGVKYIKNDNVYTQITTSGMRKGFRKMVRTRTRGSFTRIGVIDSNGELRLE